MKKHFTNAFADDAPPIRRFAWLKAWAVVVFLVSVLVTFPQYQVRAETVATAVRPPVPQGSPPVSLPNDVCGRVASLLSVSSTSSYEIMPLNTQCPSGTQSRVIAPEHIQSVTTNEQGVVSVNMDDGTTYDTIQTEGGLYLVEKMSYGVGLVFFLPKCTLCLLLILGAIIVIAVIVFIWWCANKVPTHPRPPPNEDGSVASNSAKGRVSQAYNLGYGISDLLPPEGYTLSYVDTTGTNVDAGDVSSFGYTDWQGNLVKGLSDIFVDRLVATEIATGLTYPCYLQSSVDFPGTQASWSNVTYTASTWTSFVPNTTPPMPTNAITVCYDMNGVPFQTTRMSFNGRIPVVLSTEKGFPLSGDKSRYYRLCIQK